MKSFRRVIRPATLAAWLLTSAVVAGQEPTRPWGFLSPKVNLTDKPEAAPPVDLRCNANQPVYLYLVNPTEDSPTVSVVVRSATATLGKIAAAKLPPKGLLKVNLTEIGAAAKTPAGIPLAADAQSGKIGLSVVVTNTNRPDEAPNEAVQTVNLRNPATLLGETSATFAGGANALNVNVKANDLAGPPCPVELVLSADDIPGLNKGELKGVTRGTLTTAQPSTTLTAGGLTLAPGSSGEGRASLTVDGVERAVVLKGSFKVQAGATSSPFTIENGTSVRVRAPKYAKPGDVIKPVVEVTNAPPGSKVTFTLSPGSSGGAPTQSFVRPAPREQGAAVVANEDGTLGFVTVLKDWSFQPDTQGLFGPVTLKATLTTGADVREAATVIVFDETPPKNVRFLPGDPKKFPVKNRPFAVSTAGVDNESEVAKVEFFVGVEPPAPSADGKAPAGPKPVVGAYDLKSSAWTAAIPMPEKKGPTPVYVRYTNAVGLSTVEKTEFDVCDPVPGGVKGKVEYGGRAQKVDVQVWLLSKDGKTIVKEGKVDADGVFLFKDVPAGEYVLVSEQKTSSKPLTGVATVTVVEGPDPTDAKITLKQKQ